MTQQQNERPINIGIFAHVDAGKTTLTERLLAHSGAIRNVGSVDSGTAHTDTLPVERRRGISVKATCVSFRHCNSTIQLIDTPGHADFSAEVERSLWALDAAILVVCAVEGVQPHTELLYNAMKEQGLKVLFFINKTDRDGADPKMVLEQIHRRLTMDAVSILDREQMLEKLCDLDEDIMERYLSGEDIPEDEIENKFALLCQEGKICPILQGSALKDDGVDTLLNSIISLFPQASDEDNLCGVVFAAQQHRSLGRGVWVRLFGGHLENRSAITLADGLDPITGEEKTKTLKITQIFDPSDTPTGKLCSGSIGLIYGLGNIAIGTIIGDKALLPRKVAPGTFRSPLITVQAIPENKLKLQELRLACEILSGEDPLLHVRYIRSLEELHLQVMGTIQLEILQEILLNRFDIKVTFGHPAIIYKETISSPAEGFVAYLAPKPCWAILKFLIEPAERGSGVVFQSKVPVRDVQTHYQNQVRQALPIALNQGRLGWEVTDVKITLLEGGEHKFHTHPLDFIVATPMAIQDGLQSGGSTLLEPILDIRFLIPPEYAGRVMNDVNMMRGQVLESFADGDRMILTAQVPVATSLDYAVTLASATGGKGAMSVQLHGYRECPLELGATALRRSVDPLDTSKYILAARNALEGGIFTIDQ